jgi:hypothetical protein
LSAEGIEWIIPGEWPLAGTHRGHEGDRVLVLGFSKRRVKVTNRTFEDDWRICFTRLPKWWKFHS